MNVTHGGGGCLQPKKSVFDSMAFIFFKFVERFCGRYFEFPGETLKIEKTKPILENFFFTIQRLVTRKIF